MARRVASENWKPSDGIVLEEAARRVVFSETSRSVIAGPGAGKTELLAQRALYLLQTGICRSPRKILAISFKRDAAKNLKDRVGRRCLSEQARRFDSYTFDAFAKTLVDRFLVLTPEWCRPPRDYRISFLTRDQWNEFVQGLDAPADLGGDFALRALTSDQVERWGPLPLEEPTPGNMREWAAVQWWHHCLRQRNAGISFAMIGRLAQAILTHNPQVLSALRLTYSHVFLDEFQDTTQPQYDMTALAFAGSAAVLTAVGDTKQRIMTWAGAEADVFDWFEDQFGAQRERLQMNHRSNSRIVQIINDLVREIEPNAVETLCSRVDDPVPADAAEFWHFRTDNDEANTIADFIARGVREDGLKPEDFVLLVRVRADQAEQRLESTFQAQNLHLRNEARLIEGIAIQDLLTDSLVSILLGFVRLAVGVRGREVYAPVQEAVGAILGTDFESTRDAKRLEDVVRHTIKSLREHTAAAPLEADMAAILATIVQALGEASIRRTFRQYEEKRYFDSVMTSLAALMDEYAEDAEDWSDLIDAVEGKGQVRLLTVHKSKGLEYHTVIFVGLHDNALFGYRRNREEETNTFFVALSRARERVYFTRSSESGQVAVIRGLIDMLGRANVPTVEFE